MAKCRNCKECNLKQNVCDSDMWDRNSAEETWIHSDEDFNAYIDRDILCTEYEEIIHLECKIT
jgi:antirestriction protein